MTAWRAAILILLVFAGAPLSAEGPPPVRVERVREILARARPLLEKATGMAWPEGLEVRTTDPAGLRKLLRHEFEVEIDALHPDRPASSRRILVDALSRTFARIVRAKYGLGTKVIEVSPGALDRLPEGVTPDQALTLIVTHEAVHAMDDAVVPLLPLIRKTAPDRERLRALRMVIEGRAEYYGGLVAKQLGVPESAARALVSRRDVAERLTRDAGSRFVAALAKRDPALPLTALKKPPASTSVVFHPDRYGKAAPSFDLDGPLTKALPGGTKAPLSELLLRARFLGRLSAGDVDRAFGGYVEGRAATLEDGSRVSLLLTESEKAAKHLLAGILDFEGAEPGDPVATKAIPTPDGRTFSFAASSREKLVGEAIAPPGKDARALLLSALSPPGK